MTSQLHVDKAVENAGETRSPDENPGVVAASRKLSVRALRITHSPVRHFRRFCIPIPAIGNLKSLRPRRLANLVLTPRDGKT